MVLVLGKRRFRVNSISPIENCLTLLEDERGLSIVNHSRREQSQAGMAMFLVVPTKEPNHLPAISIAYLVGSLRDFRNLGPIRSFRYCFWCARIQGYPLDFVFLFFSRFMSGWFSL